MLCRLHFAAFILALTSFFESVARAQFASSFPGPIPLFQKTPYFGSWTAAGSASDPRVQNAKPFGWAGTAHSYACYVQVDSQDYQWLGYRENNSNSIRNATDKAVSISPTRTILTMEAGPVTFNATFLSPIEPHNLSNQSFPFVYLSLEAWTTDNRKHDVQFYVEMSAEFVVGQTESRTVTYNTTRTDELVYHQMFQQNQVSLSEDANGVVQDGTLYFATSGKTVGLSLQTGLIDTLRHQFFNFGELTNQLPGETMPVELHPALAFVASLSVSSTTSSPLVFAMGYLRDPVIKYTVNGGLETRQSYFWTQFSKIDDALLAFVNGFDKAMSNAVALDTQIMNDASKISPEYADLVALSLRQTMASIEITAWKNSDNSWRDGDVKIFMRDNGVGRRGNAVETLFASFPTFLYLNPELGKYLLEPLLDFQSSSVYRNNYAAPDLGVTYPDLLGNNTDTLLSAIENCGFMLTMSLAYAMKSGDGTLLSENYNLLKTWGDYLVTHTMKADGYMSSDGLTSNGLSNMALGGIAGIYAMGKINEALEPVGMLGNYTRYFTSTASQYALEWESRAFINNHIASTYGNADSWTLAHNLFALKLINANFIKDEILDGHAAQLRKLMENSNYRYGIPYDSLNGVVTKSHWNFFTAASLKDTATRDSLITLMQRRSFSRTFGDVNPATYFVINGTASSGVASPAQGAAFALLALDLPNKQILVPVIRVDLDRAAVAGGIVGGVVGVLLIAWGVYLYLRRRRKLKEDAMNAQLVNKASHPETPAEEAGHGLIVPYLGITPDVENNVNSTSRKRQLSYTDTGPTASPTSPFTPMSKSQMIAAEASSSRRETYTPRTNTLSTLTVPSEGGSSMSPVSQHQSLPPAASGDLLMEVEVLRRELEVLRNERMMQEAPPMYFDSDPPPISPLGPAPPNPLISPPSPPPVSATAPPPPTS